MINEVELVRKEHYGTEQQEDEDDKQLSLIEWFRDQRFFRHPYLPHRSLLGVVSMGLSIDNDSTK